MAGTAIAAGSSTLHGVTVPDNQTLHQPHYTPCSAPPGEDDPEPSGRRQAMKETLGPEATPLPANLTLNLPSQRFSMLVVRYTLRRVRGTSILSYAARPQNQGMAVSVFTADLSNFGCQQRANIHCFHLYHARQRLPHRGEYVRRMCEETTS